MSWGTEKTPEVQKMMENGGDHVLCTTVYYVECLTFAIFLKLQYGRFQKENIAYSKNVYGRIISFSAIIIT